MASISDVRTALAGVIQSAVPTLHVYETVPENPVQPAAIVLPDDGDYTVAMGRGTDTHGLVVWLMVPRGFIHEGQDLLDSLLSGSGSSSVRQAVFNNPSLGLSGTDAHVTGYDQYGPARDDSTGAANYLQARITVTVHTKGSA